MPTYNVPGNTANQHSFEFSSTARTSKMADKHNIWLNNFLIPYIFNKEKSKLKKCNSVNDVHFKYAKIRQGNSNVTLFTICNKIEIVLDVDGEEKTIAVFTKVSLIEQAGQCVLIRIRICIAGYTRFERRFVQHDQS